MNRYIISSGSTADDLLPVGMALHEMLNRLPITARSKEHPGIRIESGSIVDRAYSGPVVTAGDERFYLIPSPEHGYFHTNSLRLVLIDMLRYESIFIGADHNPMIESDSPLVIGLDWSSCGLIKPWR